MTLQRLILQSFRVYKEDPDCIWSNGIMTREKVFLKEKEEVYSPALKGGVTLPRVI